MEVTGIAEDADDLKKNQTRPFPLAFCHLLFQDLLGTDLPNSHTFSTYLCRLTLTFKATFTNELQPGINIFLLPIINTAHLINCPVSSLVAFGFA